MNGERRNARVFPVLSERTAWTQWVGPTSVLLLALALAACTVVPFEERSPEIQVLRSSPDCDHEVVEQLRIRDGHEPVAGQSREWAMQANEERAMARLREQAAAAGADAVVVHHRSLSRDHDGTLMHVALNARAITACQ